MMKTIYINTVRKIHESTPVKTSELGTLSVGEIIDSMIREANGAGKPISEFTIDLDPDNTGPYVPEIVQPESYEGEAKVKTKRY